MRSNRDDLFSLVIEIAVMVGCFFLLIAAMKGWI